MAKATKKKISAKKVPKESTHVVRQLTDADEPAGLIMRDFIPGYIDLSTHIRTKH